MGTLWMYNKIDERLSKERWHKYELSTKEMPLKNNVSTYDCIVGIHYKYTQ